MASVIKAGNATDGVQVTSDNTGILELKTGTGAGTTAMTVDASQNAGLGVTPSAWVVSGKVFEIGGNSGNIAGASTYLNITSNAYYNAGYIYKTTAAAAYYAQEAGKHIFYNAPSGTAGNAITFTQAMTLDADGNLAVGTTSTPSVDYRAYFLKDVATNPLSVAVRNTNSTGATRLVLGNNSGIARFTIGYSGSASSGYIGGASAAWLGTEGSEPLAFQTSGTERARIDASGFTQFSSNLVMPYQGAPTSKAAAATLSGAELITGILSYTGAAATVNLPTGTNIEGALTWVGNNVSLDFFVINTGSGTCTIGANGNTTLGALTVAAASSAQFRIRRTAANTFTVYRLG